MSKDKKRNGRKKSRKSSSIHVTIRYRSSSRIKVESRNQSTKTSLISQPPFRIESNNRNKHCVTIDHHKKLKQKKKNKLFSRLVILLIIIGLIISVLLAILLVLFNGNKSKNRISPTLTSTLRWNKTGITIAGVTGTIGLANNLLNILMDIILNYANDIYVADYSNHRIQKFLSGSSVGMTKAGNGVGGSTPHQLLYPVRILVTSDEDLYISDNSNVRIQFWRKGAANGTTIAGITGVSGNSLNHLSSPQGICFDSSSTILYVVDRYNNRILSYVKGTMTGSLVFGTGTAGTASNQINDPSGLYCDHLSNSLVIGNIGGRNIIRYKLGENSWTLVAGVTGVSGSDSTHFAYPLDMTFDPMGNLYVVDRDNHDIRFFYNGKMNGTIIAGITGIFGTNATTLNIPRSVKLDSQLNLYVADSNNHRIQKYLRY